jgi:hypothetical protein
MRMMDGIPCNDFHCLCDLLDVTNGLSSASITRQFIKQCHRGCLTFNRCSISRRVAMPLAVCPAPALRQRLATESIYVDGDITGHGGRCGRLLGWQLWTALSEADQQWMRTATRQLAVQRQTTAMERRGTSGGDDGWRSSSLKYRKTQQPITDTSVFQPGPPCHLRIYVKCFFEWSDGDRGLSLSWPIANAREQPRDQANAIAAHKDHAVTAIERQSIEGARPS